MRYEDPHAAHSASLMIIIKKSKLAWKLNQFQNLLHGVGISVLTDMEVEVLTSAHSHPSGTFVFDKY